jgi:tetratricopeptide (TPR) repeat protein
LTERSERGGARLSYTVILTVGIMVLANARPLLAQAQTAAVNRAFDLEQAGRMRDAIAAWRQVVAAGQAGQGVLGLERVFSQLSQDDSVLPTLDSLLVQTPADKILRGVQLRVLRSLGRESDAHAAFELWVSLSPRDPTPYREYAEELLNDGCAAAADTVLRQATDSLGSTKALTIEVAQLRAALGLWPAAAAAWRDAMLTEEYLEQTAVYSLQATPIAKRDSVRAVLREATGAASKKVLGSLELQWGAAREGWRAIAALTAADSAFDTWNDFAQDAERQGQWLAARDAFAAMNRMRPSAATAMRAAAASINGDEPAPALELLASARPQLQAVVVRTQLLPLQIRVLTRLGRAAEAEALVAHARVAGCRHTAHVRTGDRLVMDSRGAGGAGTRGARGRERRRRGRSRRVDRALRRRPREGPRGPAASHGDHSGDRHGHGVPGPHECRQLAQRRGGVSRARAGRQRAGGHAPRARRRRALRRRAAPAAAAHPECSP